MNCITRGIECLRQVTTTANVEPQENSGTQSDHGIVASVTTSSRILELELMHTWTTDTFRTLSITEDDSEFWQLAVPRIALEYEYLLNGLLAITALHISSRLPFSQSRNHELAAMEYQNSAIAIFRMEFRTITTSNYQAVFAFAIIHLAMAMTVSPHVQRESASFGVLEKLLTTFHLLKGVVSIFLTAMPWATEGPFRNYAMHPQTTPSPVIDAAAAAAITWLKELNDEEYIRSQSDISGRPIDIVASYHSRNATIDKLEECFRQCKEDPTRSCLRWLAVLPEDFIESVRNFDPLAMMITMHWAILLDKVKEKRWWGTLSGQILVAEISLRLRSLKPEWENQISWIHESVGLPGTIQPT